MSRNKSLELLQSLDIADLPMPHPPRANRNWSNSVAPNDHPTTWVPIGGNNRRRNSSGSIPPVLDLHGLNSEAAIRQLVEFLWTHQSRLPGTKQTQNLLGGRMKSSINHKIVHVITGVGRHSNSTGGPVLKPAVASFLHRHGFEHCCTGGCFAIATHSGSLTYSSGCPTSTKLLVVPSTTALPQSRSFGTTVLTNTHRHLHTATSDRTGTLLDEIDLSSVPCSFPPLGSTAASVPATNARFVRGNVGAAGRPSRLDDMPRLSDVVSDEVALAQAQEASLREHQAHQRQVAAAQREELQQALVQSLRQYDRDSHQQPNTEEDDLQEAYRQSVEWGETERQAEDTMIQQVLALSTAPAAQGAERMAHEVDDDYEAMMQRALQESAELEASEREEEDALIRQAMALSVQQSRQPYDEAEMGRCDETLDQEGMENTKPPANVTGTSLNEVQSIPSGWNDENHGTLESSNRENALLMQHVLSLSENVAWKSSGIEGEASFDLQDDVQGAIEDGKSRRSPVKLLHYMDDTMVVVLSDEHEPDEERLESIATSNDTPICQDKRLLLRLLSQGSGDSDRRQRRSAHSRR